MESDSGGSIVPQLIIIVILTAINAFFAAAEMAMVSVDKKKLAVEVEEGNKNAKLLLDLLNEPSKFLSTIQVGITFANFLSSGSAALGISSTLGRVLTSYGIPFGNDIAFIGVTLILSYLTLVFGELVPKRVALQDAEKFSLRVVKVVTVFAKIVKPFVLFLSASTNTVLRLLGVSLEGVEEKVTLEEIRSIVEVGQEQGIINPTEREMIDSVICFDDTLAEEIMTARTEVFMIDINDPPEEYLDEMLTLKYSRIPVYDDEVDNIIGILYIKDFLLEAYKVGFNNVSLSKILRPAYFIPERKNIDELFTELQSTRNHMAILIDEYGGFSGIVTMEDLIEEIMGDIDDEYDHDEPDIREIDGLNYVAKGATSIKELNSRLQIDVDEDTDDYDTLGGLLISLLGYIPKDGEVLDVPYIDEESRKIDFYIEEIEDKRIQKVRIVLGEVIEQDDERNEDDN